jgi:5-methylthioadenosine/S-adenosylhomocysteine deaminase
LGLRANLPETGHFAVPDKVDLIITPHWIVPIRPAFQVLQDSSLAINEGKIICIGPTAEVLTSFTSDQHIRLKDHLLMPGLINAHGHAAMTLLRGLADDLPLMEWLNDHIWPAESKFVDADFVSAGATLAIAEMLKGGTTTFSDMYFFPESTAMAATRFGMRCQLATPILDFPSAWATNADEYIHKSVSLQDEYRHSDLINIAFGPHAPYTVADAPLKQIAVLADQLDARIQIHLHETAFEVEDAVSKTGQRPIVRLADLGLLSANTQCVHMTQVSEEDYSLVQEAGSHIIHCPESNLKLASGYCPVASLTARNINVALGTDGAASNNNLDMFGEMQTAALIAKAQANDASAINAFTALEMATINGAKALGLDLQTGSLEVGKWADMIALDMSAIELQPMYNVFSHLVYAVNACHVSHSWIAGKAKLIDRELTGFDTDQLSKLTNQWQRRIAP